jgi:hypothetical protein
MRKERAALVLAALVLAGCGGRGVVLSTPKNQAGTRSVVLPGYTPAESPGPAVAARNPAESPEVADGARNPAEFPGPAAAALNPAGSLGPVGGPAEEPRAGPEPAKKRAKPEKVDLEIGEKMFIAQTNDVYLNPEDYLGKTIRLEGLFKVEQYVGEAKSYCFVIRYGPGCCGNDGSAGFEVAWGRPEPVKALPPEPVYPEQDAWVEAVGLLDSYEEDGYPYLFLDLFSLTEKNERGAEFVSQ